MSSYKAAALLFGLNYASVKGATLSGCINDVNDVSTFLTSKAGFLPSEVTVLTDVSNYNDVTLAGMIRNLYNLALRSWTERLNFVWIHYSGHGAAVADDNGDEADKQDEALVPIDFQRNGLLRDDIINRLLSMFNPLTRVMVVMDACHSGTIADLKYKYTIPDRKCTVESNINWKNNVKVCMISGCRDSQTSADAFFKDGNGMMRASGALTYNLLKVLGSSAPSQMPNVGFPNDILGLVTSVRELLVQGSFGQVPDVSSSFDLVASPLEAYLIPPAMMSRQSATSRGQATAAADRFLPGGLSAFAMQATASGVGRTNMPAYRGFSTLSYAFRMRRGHAPSAPAVPPS